MAVAERRIDPRITRTRSAVLDATVAELADRGYGAFTIDGVASRAGVARSTIYRQWSDRTTLIGEAIDALNRQPPAGPTTDKSPRDRVITLLRHLSDAMRHSPVAACLPALIDGAERDDDVRRLHHRYNNRRRAVLVTAVADAVAAGDTHATVDPDLAATALAGAVIYRRLMTARPLRSDEVELLVNTVLGAPKEKAEAP